MSGRRDHLPVLDGGRGLATLIVIAFHCRRHFLPPVLAGPNAGRAAVCFFFMLSGFLMTYLYAGRRFDRFEIAAYLGHRASRVLPLYLVIVLGSFALQHSGLWVFPMSKRDLLFHLAFIRGNLPLWTIPVEVGFYGLFLITWHDVQAGHPTRPLVAIGLANAASAAVFILATRRFPDILPLWCHFFLYGTALALFVTKYPAAFARLRGAPGWIGWLSAALFLLAITRLRALAGIPELPGFIDPLTVTATALLFACVLFELGPMKLLRARPMRWVGRVSYGIYIYQFLVIQNLLRLDLPRYVTLLLVAIVTLAISAASHYWFEEPVRRRTGNLLLNLMRKYSPPKGSMER